MKKKRVLPADVYDTLELAAEANGGVGFGRDFEPRGPGAGNPPGYWERLIVPVDRNKPCCIFGLAIFSTGENYRYTSAMFEALYTATIPRGTNDDVVSKWNQKTGQMKMPFSEWCKALGVVRGE